MTRRIATSETEERAVTAVTPETKAIPIYRKGYEPKPSRIRPHHYAIAAALIAACGVAVYLLAFNAPPIEDQPDPNQSPPPVATLIQNTGTLTTPHGYPAEGEDYGRGEYSLSTGTAEFMLTNSVNVKLRGDTRMVMHSDMNASLMRGQARFKCPPLAKGYTVSLPSGARVIDLGTEFSIRVRDDGTEAVLVTDGEVELHTGDQRHTLLRGQAMTVDREGRPAVAVIDDLGREFGHPIAHDDFASFPAGGAGWNGPWSRLAGRVDASPGSLRFRGNDAAHHVGVQRQIVPRAADADEPVCFAASVRFDGDVPKFAAMVSFGALPVGHRARESVVVGLQDRHFNVQIRNPRASVANVEHVGKFEVGVTYRIVGRIEFDIDEAGSERLTVWVDPTDESDTPLTSITGDLGITNLRNAAVQTWGLKSNDAYTVSDVAVGPAWSVFAADKPIPSTPSNPSTTAGTADQP